MDDSLTDFQEKKTFREPKRAATTSKPKAKVVKRIKGQKDIRTALKSKKNELITYSKDFDNVCRKSGIDVDSEQLQLAIALSKSLQPSEPHDEAGTSKTLNTQQRTGLIRTTLKEYGFKVPEGKPSVSRKIKKRRKPYKLLLTTNEQKQQIISDKYTQLLFELNNSRIISSKVNSDVSNYFIYNMSTNVEYEDIKSDDVFYVEDLIEKSPNNMGCLLRDWAEIPGRPLSPTRNESEITFSEIECSQDEIDVILSGSLKRSRDILKKRNLYKRKSSKDSKTDEVMDKTQKESNSNAIKGCNDINLTPEIVTVSSVSSDSLGAKDNQNKDIDVQNILLTVTQSSRSLSPDLFEDYDDATPESNNQVAKETPVESVSCVTKETSDVMDLTECANIISQRCTNNSINFKSSQLSQDVNITKRKSNDFMEITACVGVSHEPVLEVIEEHIDLTQSFEVPKATGQSRILGENIEHMDLTQSSNSSTDTLPDVHISGKDKSLPDKSADNTILLNEIDYLQVRSPIINTELNVVNNSNDQNAEHDNDHNLHDVKVNSPVKSIDVPKETSIINLDESCEVDIAEDKIDLTQSGSSEASRLSLQDDGLTSTLVNKEINTVNSNDQGTEKDEDRSYDIVDNFDDVHEINSPIRSMDEPKDTSYVSSGKSSEVSVVEDRIDLTQSNFNEGEETNTLNINDHCTSYSKLGKKDDVSVDYDEALENLNSFPYYENDYETGLVGDHLDTSSDKVNPNVSNNAEVTKLPDNEVNTSKTAAEKHFEFGGISIIDNLPSFSSNSRSTITSIPNGSIMSDSLPTVEIKGKVAKLKPQNKDTVEPTILNNEELIISKTPCRRPNIEVNVKTPKDTEYIVKTDNVTPMLDYAAMSSPERNRELDKYGLKPFKRKRAIQILTHLYNQTHPYVESAEEITSPSKKRKRESLSQPCASKSPKKTKSPRKLMKSPRNAPEDSGFNTSDKENDMFKVTNEVPSIRSIECSAEDWVFQKREKAKLHSCRVPLHIAFHNFVSCRRRLHEAILRYEPVNIDVIHKELAASGHRYDPKDLLKFMDKKCITVKTADNTKNKNRYS